MSAAVLTAKRTIDLAAPFLITDPTSRIVYTNQANEALTGFTVAESVGKRPGDLWGGKMLRSFYDRFWATLRSKQEPAIASVTNVKKSGDAYKQSLHVAPVFNAAGTIVYYLQLAPTRETHPGPAFEKELLGFAHLSGSQAWRRLQGWLGIVNPDVSRDENGNESLDIILEEILLAPTAQRFRARTDDAVMMLAAQQDALAFSGLYRKYLTSVYRYFLQRTSDPMLSEDLTQEAFFNAFRSLGGFQATNASYLTYLLRIAHNLLVSHYRSSRATTDIDELEHAPQAAGEVHCPWDLLRPLATMEQEIMLLRYRDSYSIRDIAERLQKSENAIKLILSRARKRLRQTL